MLKRHMSWYDKIWGKVEFVISWWHGALIGMQIWWAFNNKSLKGSFWVCGTWIVIIIFTCHICAKIFFISYPLNAVFSHFIAHSIICKKKISASSDRKNGLQDKLCQTISASPFPSLIFLVLAFVLKGFNLHLLDSVTL